MPTKNNNIWLIEDNFDALGGTYKNQLTGAFRDISTLSFYPAHHITMGEGGAVLTSSTKLKLQIDSIQRLGKRLVGVKVAMIIHAIGAI